MSARNREALSKATGTGDISGGILPEGMFNQFVESVQEQSVLLDRVRTVNINRDKTKIPKIGVGERLRQAQSEDTAGSTTKPTTGSVSIDTEKSAIYWSLTKETVEDNPEGEQLATIVMNQMQRQFSVDTEDLAINGDEGGSGWVTQNDGWLTLASAAGAPSYSHVDGSSNPLAIDTDLFYNMLSQVNDKYLRAQRPVFLLSPAQVRAYHNALAGTQSDAAMAVLMGSSDITPFNYDVVGVPGMPDSQALLTDPNNLIYAIHRNVEMDVLTESDEIHEKDLYAKYGLRVRDDFAIEETDGVCVTDSIKAP